MNDRSNTQEQIDSAPLTESGASEHARQARRRFIKIGASTLPAGLTLVSRPVRAWHCDSTSAWGSAQINPNASTTARNNEELLPDESWTIANWASNTTRAGLKLPWLALGQTSCTTSGKVSTQAQKLQLKDVIAGGIYPVGLTGTSSLYTALNSGSTFQKYMLVAYLNQELIPNIRSCLTSGSGKNGVDEVTTMFSGSYKVPNVPVTWDETEIIKYLNANYIVEPS
ncbi:MAG: hypothetical protein JOY60_15210 [Burkholderiaceae bacterium]|nr:hypothetical protein [Burkholderiaceae bacterium]